MDTLELLTGCENCKMNDDKDINIFCKKCELKYISGDIDDVYNNSINTETFANKTIPDYTSNYVFSTPRSLTPLSFTTSTDCKIEWTGIDRTVTSGSGNDNRDAEKDTIEDYHYKTSRYPCINDRFTNFQTERTKSQAKDRKDILFKEQDGNSCPSCQTRKIKEPITSLCNICFHNLCSGRHHKLLFMRLKSM